MKIKEKLRMQKHFDPFSKDLTYLGNVNHSVRSLWLNVLHFFKEKIICFKCCIATTHTVKNCKFLRYTLAQLQKLKKQSPYHSMAGRRFPHHQKKWKLTALRIVEVTLVTSPVQKSAWQKYIPKANLRKQ